MRASMSHAIYYILMKRDAAKREPGAGNILLLGTACSRESTVVAA